MITTRITFVLEHDGFAGWQLTELKQLASHFRSIFVFYNITRSKHAKLTKSLSMLSLGSCRDDLCQVAIEGLDAELACMVFTEYFREHATLISASHRPNSRAESLFASHPAFRLPFDYQWYFLTDSSLETKQQALESLVKAVAKPYQQQELLTQILEREAISSTAIPSGIALPHVLSDSVNRPTLVVCKLASELDWEMPVSLMIGAVLPTKLERPWFLAITRLTRWLISNGNSEVLLSAEREETIKGILLHIMARQED
ncbi:PTS sugar transporter subunit IIA [Vibrio sp.]|uniref:PTS sugar transporter subunit IIA n=1 Tax=Vibrio sp. TaxID=678 RepID=UPI003D103733